MTTEAAVKLKEISKDTVSFIQRHLIDLGLLDPPVDGIAGPKTHAAWARFKRAVQTLNLDKVTGEDLVSLRSFRDHYSDNQTHLLSKEQVQLVFKREPTTEQVADLNECLIANNITTPKRIAHFLAQTGHESGGLRWLIEIASGAAYEGRKDLGNTQPDDGRRYRGAGVLQLTGRFNYLRFADYIGDQDVMKGAEYVAKHYPFSSAGWFWTTRNLNKLCDDGASVAAITRVVNGGNNGLADRLAYYERAKKMLDQRQSFFKHFGLTQ